MKKYKDLDCVLLVDDDISTNFIHRRIVENTKINVAVKEITSAREALDYLTYSGKYAHTEDAPKAGIIFLDINMPGMNGWDFMAEYKKLDEKHKARIVVVMLTTSLNPDDELHAAKVEEIATYLHKPLNMQAFSTIADKYFEEIKEN
ncbi:response regulator RpfG family c-di-GMP phosphodiesterase [Pedobacter africanus]|uniref:Response regulator RpfG family c-di-GMP phosphodiesterase n=1 Tax=Pedobacter africanus TaxID=151894 RepID=A0ACC6KSG4_9SPHI|nr:response regulator [Pedobacter africanus]MDR6782077.1 response regulator RpfG family c-di-GMP phosphodiesterase [Pedobacter africanus]